MGSKAKALVLFILLLVVSSASYGAYSFALKKSKLVDAPPVDNPTNDLQEDQNICNEQDSLKKAKKCTFLIKAGENTHGSGFLIDPNGYLVTNLHVVDSAASGYVNVWYNNSFHKSRIVGFSAEDDIAVVKISPQIESCSWSDSSELDLAETVYALGWPGTPEGESTITKGVYSRFLNFGSNEHSVEMVQTDTPINPGNSGGPLVSKCGVVGINTSKLIWMQDDLPSEGIGYALSSGYARPIVDRIINEDGGIAVIPQKAELVTNSRSKKVEPPSANERAGPKANEAVAYDYEKVKVWERQLEQDKKIRDSWNGAVDNEFYDQDKLKRLLDLLDRKISISKKMWDGYINSKITYQSAYNLEFEYFTLQNEVALLTRNLNSAGKKNIYEDCVKYWKDLEDEYDKDFSEQIDDCEDYL